MNKVWVYIISKPLSESQLAELTKQGHAFTASWTAHEQALSATFSIVKERLIVVKVNEDHHAASGCSIDKLLQFIQRMEKAFDVTLLDRLLVAYESEKGIQVVRSSQIPALLASGEIRKDTLFYNTSVANEAELTNWLQPLDQTWLKKYLQQA